jgi:hypothetical protein
LSPPKSVAMSAPCAFCGQPHSSLGQHWRRWPLCKLQAEAAAAAQVAVDPPPPAVIPQLRVREMKAQLGRIVTDMHLIKKVHISTCVTAVRLAETAHELSFAILKFAILPTNPGLVGVLATVQESCAAVLAGLRQVDRVCEQHSPGAQEPVPRPLLATHEVGKKQFAFFSLEALIVGVAQHDTEARRLMIEASDDWATGRFREQPSVITDVVHGERFRRSPASRYRPVETGPRRLVVVGQGWNDDATVNPPTPPPPPTHTHDRAARSCAHALQFLSTSAQVRPPPARPAQPLLPPSAFSSRGCSGSSR